MGLSEQREELNSEGRSTEELMCETNLKGAECTNQTGKCRKGILEREMARERVLWVPEQSGNLTLQVGRAVVLRWHSAQESASLSLKCRFPGPPNLHVKTSVLSDSEGGP